MSLEMILFTNGCSKNCRPQRKCIVTESAWTIASHCIYCMRWSWEQPGQSVHVRSALSIFIQTLMSCQLPFIDKMHEVWFAWYSLQYKTTCLCCKCSMLFHLRQHWVSTFRLQLKTFFCKILTRCTQCIRDLLRTCYIKKLTLCHNFTYSLTYLLT